MNNLVALPHPSYMPALAFASVASAKQKLIEHGIHLS
jgi:hypothetical protein